QSHVGWAKAPGTADRIHESGARLCPRGRDAAWSDRVGKIAWRLASSHQPCQAILPKIRQVGARSDVYRTNLEGEGTHEALGDALGEAPQGGKLGAFNIHFQQVDPLQTKFGDYLVERPHPHLLADRHLRRVGRVTLIERGETGAFEVTVKVAHLFLRSYR